MRMYAATRCIFTWLLRQLKTLQKIETIIARGYDHYNFYFRCFF